MNTIPDLTAAELQSIRTDAERRFSGRAHEILLEDPVFCRVVLAPFDRESYAAFVDAEAQDAQTAADNLMVTRRLYPDLMGIDKLKREWPAVSADIAANMELAGGITGKGHVEIARLEDVERLRRERGKDASLDDVLPRGLTESRAVELIKSAQGARLWSVQVAIHGLSAVMISPVAQIWRAAKTKDNDARRVRRGIVAATQDFVLPAIVWSSQEMTTASGDGLLDRKPGLYWWLWVTFQRMGGEGVRLRSKSLW
jgi:hypothetical protein